MNSFLLLLANVRKHLLKLLHLRANLLGTLTVVELFNSNSRSDILAFCYTTYSSL